MTFDEWMNAVDTEIGIRVCGFTSNDFPDRLYRDMYDAGNDPIHVAREVLVEEGFPIYGED